MGGAAAGGLSIASAGLSAYSTVLKGEDVVDALGLGHLHATGL